MSKQVISIDTLRRTARSISDELAVADAFSRNEYRTGYIRFAPSQRRSRKMVIHKALDVVCLVIAGRGRLRYGRRSMPLEPGLVCHVPARVPHDFSAEDEPLELLYTTISVQTGLTR